MKILVGMVLLFSGLAVGQVVNPPGGGGGGGATIPNTTNLISGSGTGNGADSGIAASNVMLLNGTQTSTGTKTFGATNFAGNIAIVGAFGVNRNTGLTTVWGTNTTGFGLTETMTTITNTSGNNFIHSIGNGANSFTPASGTGNFAGLLVDPLINGTSSGTAAPLVIGPVTNTLTGGTVKLARFGTSTGAAMAGFSEKSFIATDGTYTGPVNAGTLLTPNTFVGRSQTGALNQTIVASANTAMYEISLATNCKAAGATTSYQAIVTYTDTSNTSQTIDSSVISCTTLGTTSKFNSISVANVLTGTSIALTTSTSGAVSYDVAVAVKQVSTN